MQYVPPQASCNDKSKPNKVPNNPKVYEFDNYSNLNKYWKNNKFDSSSLPLPSPQVRENYVKPKNLNCTPQKPCIRENYVKPKNLNCTPQKPCIKKDIKERYTPPGWVKPEWPSWTGVDSTEEKLRKNGYWLVTNPRMLDYGKRYNRGNLSEGANGIPQVKWPMQKVPDNWEGPHPIGFQDFKETRCSYGGLQESGECGGQGQKLCQNGKPCDNYYFSNKTREVLSNGQIYYEVQPGIYWQSCPTPNMSSERCVDEGGAVPGMSFDMCMALAQKCTSSVENRDKCNARMLENPGTALRPFPPWETGLKNPKKDPTRRWPQSYLSSTRRKRS